ncbi:MAG: hypothetical protein ACLQVD_06585 [Capsulimonadaceae bacterium]
MNTRSILKVLVIVLVLVCSVSLFGKTHTVSTERVIPYSEFLSFVSQNQVASGSFGRPSKDFFEGRLLYGGIPFQVYLGPDHGASDAYLERLLYAHNVKFDMTQPLISDAVSALLLTVLMPIVAIFLFWMFVLRQTLRGRFPVGQANPNQPGAATITSSLQSCACCPHYGDSSGHARAKRRSRGRGVVDNVREVEQAAP